MSGRTAAATRTRRHGPMIPRRVSGPARPNARHHAPPTRPVAVPGPQRTGALRTVSDHHLLDSLLRSRAWIWMIGIALGGIVAMQVSLLKLNTGISRAVESASTLERQNAELEVQVARLSSDERIQLAAKKLGLVTPDAGVVRFVRARGEGDAARAALRMSPPSEAAQTLMAARGVGALPPATAVAPVASTPAPAATAAPTPQATPAPTAAPTSPPVTAAAPPTPGGQAAPQG